MTLRIVFCCCLLAVIGQAGTITHYTSSVDWTNDTTGGSVVDFEGVYAPGGGEFQPGGQVTVGGIEITALNSSGRLYWIGPGTFYGPSSNLTTQPLETDQFDAFQLTLILPNTAIAFELANFRMNESVDVKFRFVDGTFTTLPFPTTVILGPSTIGQFFGFTSDMAFDQVTIARTAFAPDNLGRGLRIDNITVAQAAGVPEPSTMGMVLAAVVAAWVLARRGKLLAGGL
jgi:hypothetical protein